MEKESHGVIEHEAPSLPIKSLLRVPYRGEALVVGFPAFGPSKYGDNLTAMQRHYFHSQALSDITFREPTTVESLAVAAYDFKNLAKSNIFNPNWLQAGRIIRAPEGVIANPPRDNQGKVIVDAKTLKTFIDRAKKIPVKKGNIYLGGNDFGFAEYESFKQGIQDCDTFAEGGLARILEHTEGPAKHLREIASPQNYTRGVNVFSFDKVLGSVENVASLGSDWSIVSGRLCVDCDGWDWYDCGGYVFGVLDSREAGAPKKA